MFFRKRFSKIVLLLYVAVSRLLKDKCLLDNMGRYRRYFKKISHHKLYSYLQLHPEIFLTEKSSNYCPIWYVCLTPPLQSSTVETAKTTSSTLSHWNRLLINIFSALFSQHVGVDHLTTLLTMPLTCNNNNSTSGRMNSGAFNGLCIMTTTSSHFISHFLLSFWHRIYCS